MAEEYDKRSLIGYLLKETSEPEHIRLEEHYFEDDDVFEELVAAEDDLFDAYVREDLSADERQRFERYCLASPRSAERLAFARAFSTVVARAGSVDTPRAVDAEVSISGWRSWLPLRRARPRPLAWSLATAAVLVAVAGVWLLFGTARLRNQVAALQAANAALQLHDQALEGQVAEQQQQNARLMKELSSKELTTPNRSTLVERESAAQQAHPLVAFFVLAPGPSRGPSRSNTLNISTRTEVVLLQLNLAADQYQRYRDGRYRAVLETAEGAEVWSQDFLRAEATEAGRAVKLTLGARPLGQRDYILSLKGATAAGTFENVEYYQFRLVKR